MVVVGRRRSGAQEEKGKIARMEEEVGTIESRQDELKKDLYARFGSSINLDE